MNNTVWNKNSWKNSKIIRQIPEYNNLNELDDVLKKIQDDELHNELVTYNNICNLSNSLMNVVNGKQILLMGGDCAESFNNGEEYYLKALQTLNEMGKIISSASNKGVIQLGRMAGQYCKPRSSPFEVIDGEEILSFKGEIVNSLLPSKTERKPNPQRLLEAYEHSKKIKKILDSKTNGYEFYTCHEVILLPYEEQMIHKKNNSYYLSSTAFPWIGERTRTPDDAHIEFLRGIINPIGIKIGDITNLSDIVNLINILNCDNKQGKIVLIVRMGNDIDANFPKLINAICNANLNVIYVIDPVHANTKKTINGKKTRYIDDIVRETLKFIEICNQNNIHWGGIHIEMTGLDVTECVGCSIDEKDLDKKYLTTCDPRLNHEQCIYLANQIANFIKGRGSNV